MLVTCFSAREEAFVFQWDIYRSETLMYGGVSSFKTFRIHFLSERFIQILFYLLMFNSVYWAVVTGLTGPSYYCLVNTIQFTLVRRSENWSHLPSYKVTAELNPDETNPVPRSCNQLNTRAHPWECPCHTSRRKFPPDPAEGIYLSLNNCVRVGIVRCTPNYVRVILPPRIAYTMYF